MASADSPVSNAWTRWQRVLFRFLFVYLLLYTSPWFLRLLGVNSVSRNYFRLVDWAVRASNARLFHVRETLIPTNGSGDTSWAWAELWLFLSVAAIGCAIWSALDRNRRSYPLLGYWLRTFTRYYLATYALSYGISKLFWLQMPFPTLSQMSTPLGDFLPMRFSWMFMGFSAPYQFFAGFMETAAGLLLLNRRTVTFGLFAATGTFINVVMINLSYDVPVKLFASHLLFASVFLLLFDTRRLVAFLVLNQPAPPTAAYEPPFTRPWQHWTALAAKAVVIVLILILPFESQWTRYKATVNQPDSVPFRAGVYDVVRYVVNGDTIPSLAADTVRWKDVIFDNAGFASVNTTDPLFWQRYRRGYFRYKADTATHTAVVWKTSAVPDSTFLFTMRYEIPDSGRVRLWTSVRNDSLYVELVRTPRHFQLAERQFHWLSEYNR